LGNKLRSLDGIIDATQALIGSDGVIADLFTGTTVVAQAFAQRGYRVSATDTQQYAIVFAQALLGIGRNSGERISLEALTVNLADALKREFDRWSPFLERERRALQSQNVGALRVLYDELPLIWRDSGNPRYGLVAKSGGQSMADFPLITSIYA